MGKNFWPEQIKSLPANQPNEKINVFPIFSIESHKIMFKMARVQSQITQHVKNQENLNIAQGIRQSRDENPEINRCWNYEQRF